MVGQLDVRLEMRTGLLSGTAVAETVRRVGDLRGLFRDEAARLALPQDGIVYRVQSYQPVPEGLTGGLFWGATVLSPGRVGDEYFMTKGHFHAIGDRAEYYLTVEGQGALILMDEQRRTRMEPMAPGSVHYIPGHTAHRVANTGEQPLTFMACWPSDAGHDYGTIERHGFGGRLRCRDGRAVLVPEQAP